MLQMAGFVLLLFAVLLHPALSVNCPKSPIIIIPGVMGSQLEARLQKTHSDHWYCYKSYDKWYRLWLNMGDLLPVVQKCFEENIKLHYNSTTGRYTNTPGVEIRVPEFGNTTAVETLDPNFDSAAYFDKFVEYFANLGYQSGVDILAAAFDWRLGPAELTENGYFRALKTLIESTYKQHQNCAITLVAHSMGGLVSHYFLSKYVNQEWKDMHIGLFITLGAVWAGASRPLKALISGDSDGIFKLTKCLSLRTDERSFPSDYWLMPSLLDTVWNRSVPIVTTPNKQYTSNDILELIRDLKIFNGELMYTGVINASVQGLPPPNVTTYCIYGIDKQTEENYTYTNEYGHQFPDGTPHISHGLGDGTVNLKSLRACRRWVGQQSYPVYWKELNSSEHMTIMREDRVLEIIKNLVMNK